jgi:sugar/nucleoside kinase (ribokinase family)
MIDSPELREQGAQALSRAAHQVPQLQAFVGLDGFVDQIIRVVDTRENAERYQPLPSITSLAQRIADAAGRSTNVELVIELIKLGGNGPIMANALASLGLRVTYVGALGYPTLHPVFEDFARRADVHTIAPAGQTDALEFEDGKVMLTKTVQLNEVTWANIQQRYGREKFAAAFSSAHLVAFVNWTMIPYMSDLWEALQREVCPQFAGPRRHLFFDLADPEKRTTDDLHRALDLMGRFAKFFEVTLGLNEKEAHEIGEVLGLRSNAHEPEAVAALAQEIGARLPLQTLVVHPVKYAVAVSGGVVTVVKGLFTARPKITTGAGDHFNAGFCLGRLLGLDHALSLLTGVTNSGHYVRTARSAHLEDLVSQLRAWPNEW